MKKLITSVFFIISLLCMTACSTPLGRNSVRENKLGSAFSSPFKMTLDKLNAEGTITRLGDGEWITEFESPNTLSGVKLTFSGGIVTADYKGLTFSVPKSALPVKAMLSNLIEAVDTNSRESELLGKENEGKFEINGSLEGGNYTLSLSNDGNISSFDMPNNLLHITFTNVQNKEGIASSGTEPSTSITPYTTTIDKAVTTG